MFRTVSAIFLLISLSAEAQPAAGPASAGRVLRAIPLGDEASPAARPVTPARPVLRAMPLAPVAPVAPPVIPAAPAKPTPPVLQAIAISSPLDLKPSGEDAIRLQIFLDEAKFGPGVIDGKPGRFTELAAASWNEVHGHPTTDWVAVNTAARKAVPNPLAVAIVPDLAKDWVDSTLPISRALQAKRKRMSYRSLAEFMSERYHCDIPFLIALNGSSRINNLKPNDSIQVPNVSPFRIEALTGAGYKAEPSMSQRHAVVDTKINQVRIFEAAPTALVIAEPGAVPVTPATRPNRGLIASFPITPGQEKFIKFGTWEVRNAVELPYWRYDQKLLDTGKRSSDAEALNIPPGPNSPVGIFWCGLSKPGIGLHGTSDPETIGRARSSGCIRLANWDAIRLPSLIRPGTTVEIR